MSLSIDQGRLGLQSIVSPLLSSHTSRCSVLFAWTSEVWLLPRVLCVSLHLISSPNEVCPHHLGSLSIIESDLHSSVSFASAKEVVVIHIGRDHMLHIGNLLDLLVIAVFWEATQINIDNVILFHGLFVEPGGIVTSERGGQHHLFLLSSGVLRWNRHSFLLAVLVWRRPLLLLSWSVTVIIQARRQLSLLLILWSILCFWLRRSSGHLGLSWLCLLQLIDIIHINLLLLKWLKL